MIVKNRPIILGAYSFAVYVAFWPGTTGAAEVSKWMVLGLAPLMLIGSESQRPNLGSVLGLAAIGWALLSLAWAPNIYDGLQQAVQIVLLASVFVLGQRSESLRPAIIGIGWAAAVSGLVSILQIWWPDLVETAGHGAKSGLFFNSNILGQSEALAFIGCVAYRYWWPLPLIGAGLLLAQSRGAEIALFACLLIWAWPRSRPLAYTLIVAGLGVLAFEFHRQWGGASFIGDDITRIALLKDTWQGLTFWGRGLGSFPSSFWSVATHLDTMAAQPTRAHFDALQYWYEMGVGSLLFAGLIWFGLRAHNEGRSNWPDQSSRLQMRLPGR